MQSQIELKSIILKNLISNIRALFDTNHNYQITKESNS